MEKFLTVNPDTVEIAVGEPSRSKASDKPDMLSDDSIEDKDFLDKDSEFIHDMGLDSEDSAASDYMPGLSEEPGSSKKKKRKNKNGDFPSKRQKVDSPKQNGKTEKMNGKKVKKEVKTTTYEVKEGTRYEIIHKSMSPDVERVPGEIRTSPKNSFGSPLRQASPAKLKPVSPYLPEPPVLPGFSAEPVSSHFKNIHSEDLGSNTVVDHGLINGDMLMSTIEVNKKNLELFITLESHFLHSAPKTGSKVEN